MDCVEVFSKAHLAMLPQSLVVRDEEFKIVFHARLQTCELQVKHVLKQDCNCFADISVYEGFCCQKCRRCFSEIRVAMNIRSPWAAVHFFVVLRGYDYYNTRDIGIIIATLHL